MQVRLAEEIGIHRDAPPVHLGTVYKDVQLDKDALPVTAHGLALLRRCLQFKS